MRWCWWCCHEFENTELQLPYKYDYRTDKYSTCGQFCSWSCMKTFTLDKYGITRGGQIMCNVITMRKKLYNICERVQAAPSRFSLKQFGGHLTIEEFRKGETADKGLQITTNVLVEKENIVEFVKKYKPTVNMKLENIKTNKGTNEPLRLKRSKPLVRDENNLEKTLGITRKKATQ